MTPLQKLIGKPWALPCAPPDSFDCWALVEHVRAILGLPTPSVVAQAQRTMLNIRHINHPPLDVIEVNTPGKGTIVRISRAHVGVYLGHGDVMHSLKGYGVMVSRLRELGRDVRFYEVTHADH